MDRITHGRSVLFCALSALALLGTSCKDSNFFAPSFDPRGKTEAEIIAKWGQPTGRSEIGDDILLSYPKGTVIMNNGVASKFSAKFTPSSTPASASAEQSARDKKFREDKILLINRLIQENNDLYTDLKNHRPSQYASKNEIDDYNARIDHLADVRKEIEIEKKRLSQ